MIELDVIGDEDDDDVEMTQNKLSSLFATDVTTETYAVFTSENKE